MAEDYSPQDEMRLCPTCRTPISVLATRCRFCGEEVGRPKKEEVTFTIRDLGGERHTSYTVSGNVMDALESFRAEELSAQESLRRDKDSHKGGSWIGRRPPSSIGGITTADLPELDGAHRDLSESLGGTPRPRPAAATPRPRKAAPDIDVQAWLTYGGIAIGVLVIIAVGYSLISGYIERQRAAQAVQYPNQAQAMLDRGEPLINVLKEAVEAVRTSPTPENRQIADQVRDRVIQEVKAKLNADPWDRATLDEASRIATNSATLDADPRIQELRAQVDDEISHYKFIATNIDTTGNKANFKLHNPHYKEAEQSVSVGDWLQDRFVVKKIMPSYVRLEDTKRRAAGGNRVLRAPLNSPVTTE